MDIEKFVSDLKQLEIDKKKLEEDVAKKDKDFKILAENYKDLRTKHESLKLIISEFNIKSNNIINPITGNTVGVPIVDTSKAPGNTSKTTQPSIPAKK